MPPTRTNMIQQPDFETQRQAYMELTKLCCSDKNQTDILSFLSKLQYSQDENDYDTLHTIIEFLGDNDYPFIVSLDWKQEVVDFELFLNEILQRNYNGLRVDFPKYNDNDFLPNVFNGFNEALQKHNLQIGFIDTQSDEYVFVVHQVCDKAKVTQLVNDIGYYYFDTKEEDIERQQLIEEKRLLELPTEYNVKMLLFWLLMLLLCPFFTYVAYRGFLKEGFSFMVIFVAISNLIFYYFSITNIIREFSLYRNNKSTLFKEKKWK